MPAPFPLLRNLAGLRGQRFDLLVVGGGIYGAWTAYDAALRGLSVALVERSDWAAGTSSASSKLIHGGLRYLEHFEFGLVRHALAERRTLSDIAPHLVRPLDFVVPVWSGARVSRLQLLAGLALYDLMASGRQPVARFRSLSRAACLTHYPELRAAGLRGGFRYGDCQEDDARMTLFVVAAAQGAGAVCANRLEVAAVPELPGEVQLRDTETGAPLALHAQCVVDACGPWAGRLAGAAAPPVKRVRGVHLVLPPILREGRRGHEAFLLTAPQDGRVFFVIPWYGRSLLGTTEAAVDAPEAGAVTAAERRYLLEAARAWLPGPGWTDADVIGQFAGTRALQDERAANLSAVTREFTLAEPRPRLLCALGGKFTTARCDAAGVVDRVLAALGRPPQRAATHRRALPGAPVATAGPCGFERWHAQSRQALERLGVDTEAACWLGLRHGTRIACVQDLLRENPAWSARLHPEAPFLVAEAVLAIREEMARSSDDVLRRRMPLDLLVRQAAPQHAQVESLLAGAAGRRTGPGCGPNLQS
ncbi:MAG: glycerol-3-phosphate dehydrogenase/oxidase [Nevskia sp.]|nr:glycerol-3-phosphate dehydrogenase/oxidase [Nevskia sp.]